jgi:uncharacterized membrane protein YkgB
VLGGLISVATYAVTLSLLLSLPVWEASAGGFPALNGTGSFLLKDAVLFAASVAVLGQSLTAVARLGDGTAGRESNARAKSQQ